MACDGPAWIRNLTFITELRFTQAQSYGLQVCWQRPVDLRTNEGW
jgi:hypothetical protein